nr:YLP motif-containing protein 1 [Tanacetum cinerariifolium]
MDEYFMTEVEKAEDSELSKSSGSLRGKRQVMKKVMEYCYEPEMEEAYRASMLKAFKKTLDEGVYSFIIVDDRNLRVADFAQFWATAKRSGYEVYILEASYKDPAGCAARNLHNFTLDDIQKMAGQWEEAPSLYMKMDIKSLLHGDDFDESGIQEVDMDMEDEDAVDASQGSNIKSPQESIKYQVDDCTPHDVDPLKDVKHSVTDTQTEEVNHLSKSKWSNDLDGKDPIEAGEKKKTSALSGLIQAYSKEGKSVTWGDQGGNVGFSISATRKTNTRSLVIGPGSGYNLKSNPVSEEEYLKPARTAVEPKSQSVFQEQIRAERESFKAVFDKRRQRIGGFNVDEE